MCIAIYKPVGFAMPTKKTLKTCFENNKDGAGYMFSYKGEVHIEKGLMTFKDFKASLKKTLKMFSKDDGKDLPFVLHFRITTQGGVKKELTHPFVVCDNYDEMKKTSNTCDRAIAHNGIITLTSNYGVQDHNDTMEFIKEIFYPLTRKAKCYYNNKDLMSVMDYLLDGNRFAILDGAGHCELIGKWIEDNGVYYSNSSYKDTYTSWKKTSSSIWTYGNSFSKVEKIETKPNPKECFFEKLTKDMENEMKSDGCPMCKKCGGYLTIEYDDSTGFCYGYCDDCGEIYEFNKEQTDYAIDHDLVQWGYWNKSVKFNDFYDDYCYGDDDK